MKYMGSKSKIAKDILPIIQQMIVEQNLVGYAEPFVGGANVIDKVICDKKIGADNNTYLIELYKNLDKLKLLPDIITKEEYVKVRTSYHLHDYLYPDWYIGAIGFLSSYNGRFFDGGYSGIRQTKIGTTRNYYLEAKTNLEKQMKHLNGIEWRSGDYKDTCGALENFLIYCDPPYYKTKSYLAGKGFNHEEFWSWAKDMSKKNVVLISETTCLDKDFSVIWQKDIQRSINCNYNTDSIEKLFIFNL